MAAVVDVLPICRSILGSLSSIDEVRENWLSMSEDCEREKENLRSQLEYYSNLTGSLKLPHDKSIVGTLEKAQSLLTRVDSRLQRLEKGANSDRCCDGVCWLYAKLTLAFLPEKLENSFKKVNEEIQKIVPILKQQIEAEALAQLLKSNEPNPTIIYDNDGLYVPIKQSENQVLEALKNFDGPQIILLYGGVGKGKSIMARRVCHCYGKGERKETFDYVILVLCGGGSIPDPSIKQGEILKRLSPNSLSLSQNQKGEANGSKDRIATELRNFCKNSAKKILIVLDDVSDEKFLLEMWKIAKGVKNMKYFVTSRLSILGDKFRDDSLGIAMGDINDEEANKILASLVGFKSPSTQGRPEAFILLHLQDIAKKIIIATEGNPLALACLASHIPKKEKNNAKVWQTILNNLGERLSDPDTTIVLSEKSDESRSLWTAKRLCIQSLKSKDVKVILFFIYACKGGSVPEEVLSILHASRKTSTITTSTQELSTRELLNPSPGIIPFTDQESTSWSIGPLMRLYIETDKVGRDDFTSFMKTLGFRDRASSMSTSGSEVEGVGSERGKEEIASTSSQGSEIEELDCKERLATALCALYFDRAHEDPIVNEIANWASKACSLDSDDIINEILKAIEPIIWLMDQPDNGEQWTKSNVRCARQIFLKYVCDRQLDDDNIYALLRLRGYPSAPLATLAAIYRICYIRQTPLLNEHSLSFIMNLVDLLNSTEHTTTATRSQHPLSGKLAREDDSTRRSILEDEGALAGLIDYLTKDDKPNSQALVAGALRHLAGGGDSIKQKILNGALAGLVNALSRNHNPHLQVNAAGALANLAEGGEPIPTRIVNERGAVEGLVKLLEHEKDDVQLGALKALARLAGGKNLIKLKVVSQDGALVGFVKLLSGRNKASLQEWAARALGDLAASEEKISTLRSSKGGGNSQQKQGSNTAAKEGETIPLKIVTKPGALKGLVSLLGDDNVYVQLEASRALAILACAEDQVKFRIANEDRALLGFGELLAQNKKTKVQILAAEWAASALQNLVATEQDSTEEEGSNEEVCLEGGSQRQVAVVSGSLAGRRESIKLKIINEKAALAGLVKSLSEDDNPAIQELGVMILAKLADGEEPIPTEIVNERGAIEGLVKLLENKKHVVQLEALKAMAILASGEDQVKFKIVNQKGALLGLVKLLSAHHTRNVQLWAAWVLRNLAAAEYKPSTSKGSYQEGGKSIKLKIINERGVLSSLVKSLSEHGNHPLQMHAAATLGVLTDEGEPILKIVNERGAIQGLLKLLDHKKDDIQFEAVKALTNLACGGNQIKHKIVYTDGALFGLCRLLSRHTKPILQEWAAYALGNLADTEKDQIKLRIVNEDGILSGLVQLLSNHSKPILQGRAVWALQNLARTEYYTIWETTRNQEGLFRLV